MSIENITNELLAQFEITYEEAKAEYNKYREYGFEEFEETKTYEVLDNIYEILGYDYLLYDELAKDEINGTSDLINFMFEDTKKEFHMKL